MIRGSNRYTDLKHRLEELSTGLLPFLPAPPASKISFTPIELDLTRAYIVLAHAEIESFCEDIALTKAAKARQDFHNYGRVTPVLRKLTAYYALKKNRPWSDVLSPQRDVVDSAFMSFSETIRQNHGIKRENLEKLFYPLGVFESHLSATWIAQMDTFGSNRGTWAHKSVRALNPPDPMSERSNVGLILQGLLLLDRRLSIL
jgi:hypothetical protein